MPVGQHGDGRLGDHRLVAAAGECATDDAADCWVGDVQVADHLGPGSRVIEDGGDSGTRPLGGGDSADDPARPGGRRRQQGERG